MMISSDCGASASVVEESAEEKISKFQPGPCLKKLSEGFPAPRAICHQSLSRLSFKEMAESEIDEFSSEKIGMCWSWKLASGTDNSTWYAASCMNVDYMPAPECALSFACLREFYNAFDQLEPDSNMQKLWHMLFDN